MLRQMNGHRSALSHRTVGFYPSAKLLNDTVCDEQTQPGPVSFFFCRKKWLPDMTQSFLRHSTPVVLNRNRKSFTAVTRADRNGSPVCNGGKSIAQQIEKDLLQLPPVRRNFRQTV